MTRSLLLLSFVLATAHAAAAQVPAEFQGDWVAARAACGAPLRVRVEAARITLQNGADMEAFGGIEMAGPSYFGPGYAGIQAVAITEFDGDQPVTATFNLDEKKGVAQMELAAPSPGRAPNAAVAALNARFSKLNLSARFPLNRIPLKRCASAARGR
jgi:hypothetical protein